MDEQEVLVYLTLQNLLVNALAVEMREHRLSSILKPTAVHIKVSRDVYSQVGARVNYLVI